MYTKHKDILKRKKIRVLVGTNLSVMHADCRANKEMASATAAAT
jgi:hypothetical protein